MKPMPNRPVFVPFELAFFNESPSRCKATTPHWEREVRQIRQSYNDKRTPHLDGLEVCFCELCVVEREQRWTCTR